MTLDDRPHHYHPTREGRCEICGRAPRSHRAQDAAADAAIAAARAAARGITFIPAWCDVHGLAHVCAYAGSVRATVPAAPGELCPVCHAAAVPVELQAPCDCAKVAR